MKQKILIADDSLTIQKVIKITLASENFELFECEDATKLEASISENNPSIILLDFNLSEDKTGYDLSADIKAQVPNAKVLMLYGTFDNIDEQLLHNSGASNHIIKPFDGNKFIHLCRGLAEEVASQEISPETSEETIEEVIDEDTEDISFGDDIHTEDENDLPAVIEAPIPEDIDEDWVVEQPTITEVEEELTPSPSTAFNSLEEMAKDWGMDVPGVIDGGEVDHLEFPDIIQEEDSVEITSASQEDALEVSTLPSDNDLEYPDMTSGSDSEPEEADLDQGPQLVSLSELAEEPAEVEAIEQVNIGDGGTDSEEAVRKIEDQIQDEVEEGELWGADLVEEQASDETFDLPIIEPHKLHEVMAEQNESTDNVVDIKAENLFDHIDEEESRSAPEDFPSDVMDDVIGPIETMDPVQVAPIELGDDFEQKLKEKLTPVVEEFVKEYCRESVEKIAWEIIPELAENLIKKEIQKITESVLKSQV